MSDTPIENKPHYAVIDLTQERYYSLGRFISKAFANQMQTMLEPSIRSAVHSLVYTMLDKVSEDSYSEEFDKVLNASIKQAIQNDELKLSEENLDWIYSSQKTLQEASENTKQRAKDILSILSEVKMDGDPYKIKLIMDFIETLAYPRKE